VTLYPVIQILVYTRTGVVFGVASEGGMPASFAWAYLVIMGTITHDIVMHATAERFNNINTENVERTTIPMETYEEDTLLLRGNDNIRKPVCSHIHYPTKPSSKLLFLLFLAVLFMVAGYFASCLGYFVQFGICVNKSTRGFRDIAQPGAKLDCRNTTFTFFQAPPFYKPNNVLTIWTMSEAFPFISFQLFNTGFSMLIYSICFLLWDMAKLKTFFLFTPLGLNSLFTYVFSSLTIPFVRRNLPLDSPAAYVYCFGSFSAISLTWLAARFLQSRNIYITL